MQSKYERQHLCKGVKYWKIIKEFTGITNSTTLGQPVLLINIKTVKTNTLPEGLTERTLSVVNKTITKVMLKEENGDQQIWGLGS